MKFSGNFKNNLEHQAPLDQLIKIDQSHMNYCWSEQQWREIDSCYFFNWLMIDDEFVGFSLFHIVSGDSVGHLLKIVVHPEFRRRGVAQALLEDAKSHEALKQLESIYLEVAEDNREALEFYRNLGFEELVIKKNFYSDGETCIAMQLRLR